ncbi:MAG TPA: phosphatase PAP2 family protein [Gemmatimonadaceae bacterium]
MSLPLPAQQADSARVAPQPVIAASDFEYLGAAGVATVAVAPFDARIAAFMQTHGQHDRTLQRLSHVVEAVAVPGAFIIGGGLYIGGKLGGDDRMADLGLHGTEALVIANVVTSVVKFTTGRARPYVDRTRPHDFAFMRGLQSEDYRSFPSGHAVTAFAAAAAVTEETRRWWPHSTWYVGPLLYGGATLVGAARMYNDKHWASDVVMGAAIGIFTGRRVVRWQHSHDGNKLDRWLLGVSIGPEGGGHVVRIILLPVH